MIIRCGRLQVRLAQEQWMRAISIHQESRSTCKKCSGLRSCFHVHLTEDGAKDQPIRPIKSHLLSWRWLGWSTIGMFQNRRVDLVCQQLLKSERVMHEEKIRNMETISFYAPLDPKEALKDLIGMLCVRASSRVPPNCQNSQKQCTKTAALVLSNKKVFRSEYFAFGCLLSLSVAFSRIRSFLVAFSRFWSFFVTFSHFQNFGIKFQFN